MDTKIIVQPNKAFGRVDYWPVSPFATLLTKVCGQHTLTKTQLMELKDYGFTVEEQAQLTLG